ncbi:bifunctional hydroxymethylpyrimidine kinase/phosphomethylpyrimidine kinase [candidate division WOR-3 bacterium JGI_Cruoil_03_44_89]|uniref:hydroxymethylpyrimidine kinase n=1 Tax=candidate division WOR-3 bacterium JGI_Cruoil_03_44_89 TaxID=1973748 RepID=A0A235BWY2_UNCW3|nr:MAG: bifunctional hydroxymethylpyrimidine kinase/phosphomethylpyrimidine kinase [candidate division WOR-3 bacterium JGI_Cruoil_03_44_89]
MNYEGKALTIAGSDSGGGAGIQADLKTFQAFNVFGMSVVTSVTSQNTLGVRSIRDIPPDVVGDQIDMIMEDIGTDAAKTGMVSNKDIIGMVVDRVKKYRIEKLVVDPVMVAKSGARLLRENAESALTEKLLPVAFLVTPNVFEAEILSGTEIGGIEDAKKSARLIRERGVKFVLLKGGHLSGERAIDILFDGRDFDFYESERVDTENTHGTGCTFSAAITAGLSRGMGVHDAIKVAKDYITRAIRNAPTDIGGGHGPLYHNIRPFEVSAFEEAAGDFDSWFDKNKVVFESELLAEKHFLPNPENSVSIGVGSGLFASRLGIEYGVEPSKEMAKLAEKGGIKVKIGTAEEVPFEDGRFDTALLSTILSYVGNPEKAVREAYRILKHGGHIVVSFLAREGSYAMMYDLAYLRGKHDPKTAPKYPYPLKFIKETHWRSTEEVTNLLEGAGFVDLKYVQTLTKHPRYTNDEIEEPVEGYERGDYIVIRGRKP